MRDQFRTARLPTPELDARLLAERAFALDRMNLVRREQEMAEEGALTVLAQFATRRLSGEPVARILGEQEFYGLPFALSPATLVPRPETELLVSLGLEHLAGCTSARILDLGTGTGCIAIALLANASGATAVAVDLSPEALETASANAGRNGVGNRIDLRQGSWLAPLGPDERFDLVVTNPPYIETADIAGLASEVREHDPLLALDGGDDGLHAYREIAAAAPAHMSPGALLLAEIGWRQAEAVSAIFRAAGLVDVTVRRDLAGLDRVVAGYHIHRIRA